MQNTLWPFIALDSDIVRWTNVFGSMLPLVSFFDFCIFSGHFFLSSIQFGFNFYSFKSVKKVGYFPSDCKQAEDVICRFMNIYDSLGTVLKCESRYVNWNVFKFNLNEFSISSFCILYSKISEFGVTIIILIASSLFHLVLTLYFILTAAMTSDVIQNELLGQNTRHAFQNWKNIFVYFRNRSL